MHDLQHVRCDRADIAAVHADDEEAAEEKKEGRGGRVGRRHDGGWCAQLRCVRIDTAVVSVRQRERRREAAREERER